MKRVYIDTMEKLNELIYDHPFDKNISRHRDLYVYRGVPDSHYSLVTSLQRICKGRKNEVELSLLNNFAKYAELEAVSIRDSVWRKMMLGQHHGLPTRLLDWSKSPLMALHFATTEGNMDDMDRRDCAVYRLDVEKLHGSLPQAYIDEMKEAHQKVFTIEMLNHVCADLKQYDADMMNNNMVIVEPPSMDERIMNQYAFFSICPAGVEKVDDILQNHEDAVVKYVISKNLRWEVRDMLDMSNINERVVYPGLDGIATWLSRHYFVRNVGRLVIEKKNLVDLETDAIVNSADEDLVCSGSIAKSIFERAGFMEVTEACNQLKPCPMGRVAVTEGYNLKAKYIIHAVTPDKADYDEETGERYLRSCYREALEWLVSHNLHSIGFPLLAAGYKGFGSDEAWRFGLEECDSFLKKNEGYPLDIVFCVLNEGSYILGKNQLNSINGETYRYPELVVDGYGARKGKRSKKS